MKNQLLLGITLLCVLTFAVIPKVSYSGIASKPQKQDYPFGIGLFNDNYALFGMRASLNGVNLRFNYQISKRWSVHPAFSQAWPRNRLLRKGLPSWCCAYPISLTNIDLDIHLNFYLWDRKLHYYFLAGSSYSRCKIAYVTESGHLKNSRDYSTTPFNFKVYQIMINAGFGVGYTFKYFDIFSEVKVVQTLDDLIWLLQLYPKGGSLFSIIGVKFNIETLRKIKGQRTKEKEDHDPTLKY